MNILNKWSRNLKTRDMGFFCRAIPIVFIPGRFEKLHTIWGILLVLPRDDTEAKRKVLWKWSQKGISMLKGKPHGNKHIFDLTFIFRGNACYRWHIKIVQTFSIKKWETTHFICQDRELNRGREFYFYVLLVLCRKPSWSTQGDDNWVGVPFPLLIVKSARVSFFRNTIKSRDLGTLFEAKIVCSTILFQC